MCIVVFLLAGVANSASPFANGGTYRLRAQAGAAAESSDARYRLQSSLGQAEAGVASGDGRWRLRAGFWPQPLASATLPDRIFRSGFE